MLSVQIDANGTSDTADDKQYLTYQHYDLPDIATGNNGDHLDYVVDPSAITGYDKDSDDLVHFGTTDFIQPNQGRIEHMVYFDGTTTASESAGDVNGYLQATFLQHGYDDESPVQILGQDYYSHTYHGATVYPVANEYVYYNGDPEATNHTYTWALDGSSDETNRIQSEAITYPSNSSAQNGPDDNDVTTTVFDAVGRPVWSMDEDGFISYTQYDSSTGALVKQIQDVDTSSTGEFSGKPDGWTTPSGGGLNLIITMQVDNLGRTTKLTDPNGNVTYTVYDDVNHESRIYRGWTGTTTTGPIIVNRQNWPIVGASVGERTVYFETLTSSATPTVDGSGVPTGQETVNSSNIQSLTRTLTNDAGQKTEVDRYPTLSGVTYSATPYLGTAGTNYYATLIAYDGRGRVKRVLAPTGTITRYLYDVRGLLTSTWVGTDDIPSTMGVYWSPAMPSGTNLVKVSENVYDFGLTGDGNLTSMTTYPGGDADPRVTEMFYDWRDRLVIEKDGTQASESTSRPLTYWDYNDQNQVISRREYDGEGVLTDPPPPTIANSSFETPPETEEVDEPTVTSWTFDGGNGVTGIVPKDFFGFDTPDGSNQFARMNTDSDSTSAGPTISQTFTNDYAGRFKFGFEAEQDGAADAAIEIELRIDGTVIGTFTPNYGIFAAFYASTDLSAGSHTITLQAFSSTEFAFAEGWLDAVSVSLDTSRDDLNSDGIPDVPSSSLLRAKTTYSYDDQGRVYRSSTFSVDPSDGTVSTDALNINYFYDHRGNVIKVSQPGGLVYKYQYDGADRVTKTYTTDGADSRTGNSGSLDGTWAQAADIVGDHVLEQTENQYDADGNVIFTITKQRFDNAIPGGELGNPSSTSPTPRARDYYVENYYDALDRLTGTADLGTNDGTVLSSRPDSVLPSASDDVLTNSYEYQTDELQSIQITGSPTSGSFKLVFEGDETSTSITYGASALTVQGVLEDLGTIGPGNVSVTKDATSGVYRVTFTGDLANKHLPQITATSASFVGGMSPGVSVNTIVTGSSGWLSKATDPRGIVSLSDYDMLGRSTRTIAAFTDGVPTDADDQTTDYTYDGDDHVLTMTAKLPGDAFQTTEYIYDATQSDSNLNSNDILTAIEYPDVDSGEASSDEKESFTVNALGERTSYTDRDGTTHSYGYDVLGRLTSDNVTGHLGGVDDAVTKLGYSYDSQGLLEKATSYNSSGGVVNQVEDAYNGLGQLITEYQEHSGAVNISTSSKVQYTYNEMADDANNSRITSITYPDGRETDYLYSTTVDNRISRLTGVAQVIHTGDPELGDTVNWYEIYSYLGLNTIIRRARPEPNITLTYAKLTGELDGGAGDQYVGLDRFGRVVDQRWFDSSHDDVDRFQYGYDRDGNVLFKLNVVNTSDSELYTYDNLNRLITFERGTLNSSKDGITGTPSNSQSWSLDAAGNWISATLYGFPQSIENNQQNEMTENGSTSQTYSGNGNLITDDHGNLISYTYDAWNRLVGYNYDDENDDHDIQAYAYDALGTRIQMLTLSPDTRDGHEGEYFASNTIDLYYNDNWQVVQENTKDGFINSDDTPPIIDTDGEMAPTYDYLWSPVLPDSLIWRGEDDDFDGVTDTRLYAQQDANGNVTSTSDSSGDIDTRYLYDPYGNATVLDSSWSSTSNIFGWVYMYQDQRLDPATGLYSMRMRDYSPDLGRFIQADPAGYVNGANRYAFVGDSPEGRTDPMGLDYTVDEDSGSGGNAGRAAMPSIYRRPILPPPPPQQPINPNPNGPELLGDPSGKPSNHGDATPTTQPGTGSSPATCPCATSTQPASAPGVPIIWKLGDRDPDVRAQGSKELEKYNMQDIWDEYVKGGHSLTELIALQAAYKAKLASGAHWDDPGWVSHFEDFLAVNGQEAKTCDELKYWYYEYLGIDPAHTKEKDIDRMSLIYWEQGRWESDWTNGGEIAQ
jgi:RHS repeat-associated protein